MIYCVRRTNWLLLLFDNIVKYSNTMLSICKFSLRKINLLRADEDGRMLFLHNQFLLYVFKCKWNRETGQIWTRISNFVQYNSK